MLVFAADCPVCSLGQHWTEIWNVKEREYVLALTIGHKPVSDIFM